MENVAVQHVNVTRREPPPATRRYSRGTFAGAIVVAALSDAVSIAAEFVPPVQFFVDVVTALAIWGLLGWRPAVLIGLVAEAVPGLAAFPTWLLVVLAYGVVPRQTQQHNA